MIVGTAGHIDHGKTALVKALTGVDTDRLPEEKARGITLDLGYAYSDDGRLGFIDVPGHEKLVRNMLAGATGIDFLLLVIAADDGPMPQTREHLAIAGLLGLTRGAVALTKIDRVEAARLESARAEVAALLAGSPLRRAPLFTVAAPRGDGIAELRAHLLDAADALGERRNEGGFRLAIDRAFNLPGVGLVVTGTAVAGRVALGDELVLTPPGTPVRVRSLHAQDRPAASGRAGQRIALNLAGGVEKSDVARGMWLVAPRLHHPVQRFHCEVTALEVLRHGQPLHLHHGAADVGGRLALLEGETLAAGGRMLGEVVLDQPLGALAQDRFILRDQSATRTLGGGRVLDIFPPARHKRAPAHLALLRRFAEADAAAGLMAAMAQQPGGVDFDRHLLANNLDADAAQTQAADLVLIGAAGRRLAFTRAGWSGLAERALAALAEEHRRAPDMIGVGRDRLRRLTLPALEVFVFERLVEELAGAGKLIQSGGWLHLPDHHAVLLERDADLWRVLRPLLEVAPFQPPRVRDIAHASGVAEDSVRALLQRVARVGQVYPVAHDHYFTAAAVANLATHVEALCARDGAARAAALRDAIGGGRKVAVQILEFFDRVGYTRRVRDTHVLRNGERGRAWVGAAS